MYRNNHFIEIDANISSEGEDGEDIPMAGEYEEEEWRREQQNKVQILCVVKTWDADISIMRGAQLEGRRGDAWEKRQKDLMWCPKLNMRGK